MRRFALSFTVLVFCVLCNMRSFSQSAPLIVNMQVLPPYSPYLSDYVTLSSAAVVTITNTTAASYDIKIAVHITGDNGIEAYTNPGFTPTNVITVGPFATRVLNGNEFQSYNDVGYTVTGIDEQQLAITGLIPDGYYTLCIQALDYTTNAPLSGDDPIGCIPLNIQYLDAPYLLSPFCADTVDQTFPQNIVFNWITPPGAPFSTLYDFKLVEVIPATRNPYDAMEAATTPAFFETTVNVPVLVYGPAQPPLESGHTYAWQVTAFNPTTNLFFQNDGKSEVCSFVYNSTTVNYVMDSTYNPVNFSNTGGYINGNLQFYYASDNATALKNLGYTKGGTSSTKDLSNSNDSPFQLGGNDDSGKGNTDTKGGTTSSGISYPFGNEPVRLVVKYMLKYNNGQDSVYLPYNTTGAELPDNDDVLSYATTSSNGDFSFSLFGDAPETGLVQRGVTVTIPDANLIDHYFNTSGPSSGGDFDFDFGSGPIGTYGTGPDNGYTFSTSQNNYGDMLSGSAMINNNPLGTIGGTSQYKGSSTTTVNYSGGSGDDIGGTFTGDLYKVLQVYVNNAHYCMPNRSFRNLSDSANYVGEVKSRVRDYVLDVTLSEVNDGGTTNYMNTSGNTNITLNDNSSDNDFVFDLSGGFSQNTNSTQPEYYYMYDEDNDDVYTSQLNLDFQENGTSSDLTYEAGGLYRYTIYRDDITDDIPSAEGQNENTSPYEGVLLNGMNVGMADVTITNTTAPKDYGAGRTLISRLESTTGHVSFDRLVKSLDEGDYYILVIEPVDDLYLNPAVEIKFRYTYDYFTQEDKAIYSVDYETPEVDLQQTENTTLSSIAVVTGKINYKYDDAAIPQVFPLKNVSVTLQRVQYVITEEGEKKYSRYRTDLITTTTDGQGQYVFNYTDTAAYGFIAFNGQIIGEDDCSVHIPDEENPDIPGRDQIYDGGMNFQIEQNHMHAEDEDFIDMCIPSGYGKSAAKRMYIFGAAPAPNEQPVPCSYTGMLYQELAIKVESDYYTSPATHFTMLPAQYKEVSDLTCYAKAYDLTLTLIPEQDPDLQQYVTINDKLREMVVVLLRENKPDDVPENEVIVSGLNNAAVATFITDAEMLDTYTESAMHVNLDGSSDGGDEYFSMDDVHNPFDPDDAWTIVNSINQSDIIACGIVSSEGQITFKNLIKNVGSTDNYRILAIPDYTNSDVNYLIPEHAFKTDFNYVSSHPYGALTITTTESTAREGFYPKMQVKYTMEAIAQDPVILGKVLRSDNGFPLLDVDVNLNNDDYGSMALEMSTKTKSDGSYFLMLAKDQYTANGIQSFNRQIKFSKYGYDDNTVSIDPMKKGMIQNKVADTLQPAVLVTGYIYTSAWNESTQSSPAAPAYVQIGNGPQVHTDCQDDDFLLDPGILDNYLEGQGIGDITTIIPNYEEMWENNMWDPGEQVFQNDNSIDYGSQIYGGTDVTNGINTGFDPGAFNGNVNGMSNRSSDGGGTSIKMNDSGSSSNSAGRYSGTTIMSDDGTTASSGIYGGTIAGSTSGSMGLGMNTNNNCELAFYATFASRGTWLAEINPDSSNFTTHFENVYIPDDVDVYRIDFIVYQKLHRMHFIVKDIDGNAVDANIEIVGITDVLSTGGDGIRDFNFANSGNTFTVLISGKEGTSYVQKEMVITNEESEYAITYNVTLVKGVTISGTVTSNSNPVENARVFVDAAGLEYLEAYTDAAGKYTLYGVPKTSGFTMRAVKESSGLIGDSKWIVTNLYSVSKTGIDFVLTSYTAMDISKLVGFNTEIEYMSTAGSETKISGRLVNIAGNNNFDVADDVTLPFNLVKIKASTSLNADGVPYAEPVDASFTIDNSEPIPVTAYDDYLAQAAITAASCTVEKVTATSGKIKAPIKILETTFTDEAFNFSGYGSTGFYLKNASGMSVDGQTVYDISHDKIVLFASGTAEKPDKDYYEIEASGKLSFNVQNAAAYIESSNRNRLYADSVVLDTWMDPDIDYTEGFDTPLNIGKIHITPTSVSTKSGTTPFTVNMDKWDLNCTSWALNNTGFHLNSGQLDAAGVDFGFTNMKIEDGELVFETSQTLGKSSVKLIDLLTMQIENDPDLIYNGANWQIFISGDSANPAASIDNVPGLPSGNNDINMEILLFYSDADAEFKMANNNYTLYSVTTFTTTAGALYVHHDDATGENYLTLPGIINLNLPSISVQPTAFLIKNNNGTITTELQSFGFGMEVNGITADFNAGDIEFKSNGLIVSGSVREDPYFDHDVKLYHLLDSTAINTIANQKFQYTSSGQNLGNLFGRMYVNDYSNSWTNYQFTGDVTGANKSSGRWTFTVYGDITAENQKVDVDDLKMGSGGSSNMNFDNMGMSYDFDNRRLVGSISIDESMPGGGSIRGQANCVYDDAGWYFVCGGQVTMPSNPYVTDVSLALLFGDYPIANEQVIKDVFTEYSYNGALPAAFASDLSGFYFDGKIEMPIPYVPNFEIDLLVVSVEFEATITAGFQLGMNFTEALNTYYTGLEAGIHVHAGVGASVVVGCAGVSVDASVLLELTGQYQSNGDWFVNGTNTNTITGTAYAGVGLACDSECEGACTKATASGSLILVLEGEVGSENGDEYTEAGIKSIDVEFTEN